MRVCRALLGSEDAQDAWSETFLAALRAYPDLRPESNVRGWLVTIAHHKAIDQIRARDRNPASDGRGFPRFPSTTQAPRPTTISAAALDALPTKQRAAVIYRYLADLPYAEVADLLDSSEAAARRSAADGIAKLRATYREGRRPDEQRKSERSSTWQAAFPTPRSRRPR